MANFQLKLTPDLVNLGTDGSLDTSVTNGVSIQRTGYVQVDNSGRKMVMAADGDTFSNTLEVWSDNANLEDA